MPDFGMDCGTVTGVTGAMARSLWKEGSRLRMASRKCSFMEDAERFGDRLQPRSGCLLDLLVRRLPHRNRRSMTRRQPLRHR